MEEKIRKIFNITTPFPPIKSLPPKSPPGTPAERPPGTMPEQNLESKPLRTSNNGVSLARALALDDAESSDVNKVILSEREEAYVLKEQELQKREYNLSILEREMDQKLAEITNLDQELRAKLASVNKREAELAKREELVTQQEAIVKKKHGKEIKNSADFVVVGPQQTNVKKSTISPRGDIYRPIQFEEELEEDDVGDVGGPSNDGEDQEDWIVVTDDGFQDKKETLLEKGLKKITHNFKCSVPECGRVIFVFESKYKCFRCESVYCLEHSMCIKPAPIAKPVKTDEVLGVCAVCAEHEIQTMGRTRDLNQKFASLRKGAADIRLLAFQEREELVKSNLRDIAESTFPPVNAITNVLKNNPVKNIVLTNKETWKSCSSCGTFFGRLSMRHVCRMCDCSFCETCGDREVEFSPLQLFGHVLPPISIPKWQTVEIEICNKCEDLVLYRQRSFDFSQNIAKRKSLSSNLSKQFFMYANLSAMYIDVTSKLEQLGQLLGNGADSADHKEIEAAHETLEELLTKFQDNVRMLNNYNNKNPDITPTEFRVLENTKVFFKRELRDSVVQFQKFKQVSYYRGVQPTEKSNEVVEAS